MTDYFALLEQPRVPWLDPVALKEVYHRKTLETHPDAVVADRPGDFPELNEAYQVLQDPKRRLHHLLSLENWASTSANQTIPADLQELFLSIGALNQDANPLLEQMRTTPNALSRSLLKRQIVELQKETGDLRDEVRNLDRAANDRLREISLDWRNDAAGKFAELSDLHSRFAYLSRWSAQLDELMFQLSG